MYGTSCTEMLFCCSMTTSRGQLPGSPESTFTASSRVHPDKQQLLAESWNEVAALYVKVGQRLSYLPVCLPCPPKVTMLVQHLGSRFRPWLDDALEALAAQSLPVGSIFAPASGPGHEIALLGTPCMDRPYEHAIPVSLYAGLTRPTSDKSPLQAGLSLVALCWGWTLRQGSLTWPASCSRLKA